MDRASRVVIRMRQKVVVPPVPTTPPRWVVDPDFDLDYHLRRVALPAPGTLRQLLDLAEVTLQSPLDTSRALWEAVYVEGLAGNEQGDRAALLIKLSHAITDGLGALALFEQIYDTEREPAPRPMPPVPVPRDLSGEDLLRDSLRQWPATTLSTGRNWLGKAVGTAARLITRPGPTVAEVLGFADSARRVLGPRRPSRRRCCAAGAWRPAPTCSSCRSPTCARRPRRSAGRSTTLTSPRCAVAWAGTTRCSACRSMPCRWPFRSACAAATTRRRATGFAASP